MKDEPAAAAASAAASSAASSSTPAASAAAAAVVGAALGGGYAYLAKKKMSKAESEKGADVAGIGFLGYGSYLGAEAVHKKLSTAFKALRKNIKTKIVKSSVLKKTGNVIKVNFKTKAIIRRLL